MAPLPDDHSQDDTTRPEYDFKSLQGLVRGKYAERYRERLRIVHLDADIAAEFSDEAAVNAALREYLQEKKDRRVGVPSVQHP